MSSQTVWRKQALLSHWFVFTDASIIIPLGGVYGRVAMNLVTVLTFLSFQGARFNLLNSVDMNSQPMASVSRHGIVESAKDLL